MGFILFLLFLFIIFLYKEQEGLTPPDEEEWNKMLESIKHLPSWENIKLDVVTTAMAMNVEKLKLLMEKDSLKDKNLGGAKIALFEDVKKSKREYTDENYQFINGLVCYNPTLVNKPLTDVLEHLTTQGDIFSRIKDEYKATKDTTLKELDDKIKDK